MNVNIYFAHIAHRNTNNIHTRATFVAATLTKLITDPRTPPIHQCGWVWVVPGNHGLRFLHLSAPLSTF